MDWSPADISKKIQISQLLLNNNINSFLYVKHSFWIKLSVWFCGFRTSCRVWWTCFYWSLTWKFLFITWDNVGPLCASLWSLNMHIGILLFLLFYWNLWIAYGSLFEISQGIWPFNFFDLLFHKLVDELVYREVITAITNDDLIVFVDIDVNSELTKFVHSFSLSNEWY